MKLYNVFADEFTRTMDDRSPGKAEWVWVVTGGAMTKKGHHFWLLR